MQPNGHTRFYTTLTDVIHKMRIPIEFVRVFRFDVGHHSELKPATYSN